jgi:hypothetical protein
VTGDGEALSSTKVVSSEAAIPCRLSYTLTGTRAVTLRFGCDVKEGDALVLRRRQVAYVAPYVRELAELDRTVRQLAEMLPRIADRRGIEERVAYLQAQMPGYRDRVQIATVLPPLERRKLGNDLAEVRTESTRMLAVAECAAKVKPGAGVFVTAANPWAPFGGVDELVEGRTGKSDLLIEAFRGETEAAALNVFNPTDRPMTYRVELSGLSEPLSKRSIPAREAVVLREAVNVPTLRMDWVADALPLLNQGQTIHVPAWGARQLWFSVSTARLSPGTWTGKVRLRALDTTPREVTVPLTIEVWPAGLPEKQPLRLCHWGYVARSVLKDQPEAALKDQIDHGTNVFVDLYSPIATFDKQGNIVGEIDYKAHDDYVRRHARHGIMLIIGWHISGPAKPFTPIWTKAAVAYIRAWVKHLAGMGVGYDGFAFYPVDEPGLRDGLVDLYINYAKVTRQADPKILMYTDPVAGAGMDDLKRMAPYVDIWCPNRRGYLMGFGAEKLAFIKSTGKTVWTYECEGDAKHQSPLGYYRGQAWLVWQHGLTGIGFWNYCVGPEPWYEKGEYTMIYEGEGVVPSKRWEAVRDGIEDYSMLVALRASADAAEAAGRAGDTVKAARKVLSVGAASVGAFCGNDEDGTLPGVEGARGARIVADHRWQVIQATRQEIARLLDQLAMGTR